MSRDVHIASCVGGGPMERLARRLAERGVPSRVVAEYSAEAWRRTMAAGPWGRARGRLGAFVRFPARMTAEALRHDASVMVPTTNPFILPLVAVALRGLHRRSVTPLVYDLWPDALEAGGIARAGGWASRLGEAANRYWFARADGVVFIGERMARFAIARYGEPRRWTVIETGADSAELAADAVGPEAAESDLERWCEGKLVAAYVGNMGRMHDVATLRDAVPRALAGGGGAPLAVVVAASGPGVEALREAWRDLPATRVRFEPPLGDRAWARLLVRAAIAFVTLRDEASRTCIPSKAFSALAAGEALCVIAPEDSDLAELVRRHGCGRQVAPGDVDGLVATLGALADDAEALASMRAAARAAASEHYDIGRLAVRWRDFLASLTRRDPDPGAPPSP
ncbi:MAG: glycosyltransferase [Deltaproteobacteria bacterium]|nr:glycosyltransferase [Deltaproteobacteria bacterium]